VSEEIDAAVAMQLHFGRPPKRLKDWCSTYINGKNSQRHGPLGWFHISHPQRPHIFHFNYFTV